MTVAYTTLQNFPQENLVTLLDSAFEPWTKVRCAWTDRFTLISEFLNSAYPYVTGSTAVAYKFAVKPFEKSRIGGTAGKSSYDDAEVTIWYTSRRNLNVSNSLYFSEQLYHAAGVEVAYLGGDLYWDSGHTQPLVTDERKDGPVIRHSELKYVLTYYQVPSITAAWLTSKDYVNSGTMATHALGYTFAQDTVRYEGMKAKHAATHSGTTLFTVELTFSYTYRNGLGWQGVYNPATGLYAAVYNSSGTQVLQYPRTSFAF